MTKTKRGHGRLVLPMTVCHFYPVPSGALQVSGGCVTLMGDPDRQTSEGKEKAMFARIVECQAKDGKGVQISTKVTNDVLPIRQEQPGFVDFFILSDRANAERLVLISFWTSREDTAEYHRRHYETIASLLKPFLESPPTLKAFAVSASTVHRIARAA